MKKNYAEARCEVITVMVTDVLTFSPESVIELDEILFDE